MRCLYLTQEYAPFFAEGGLGLFSTALPAALQQRHGWRHDIVLPYYPDLVRRFDLRTEKVYALAERTVAGVRSGASVHRLLDHGGACEVFLIRADAWYDRPGIYRDAAYAPFADEAERAAFFGWCLADWVAATRPDYDLVHGTEWQSGAAMAHLRAQSPDRPQLLTVLNGLYQGVLRTDPGAVGLPAAAADRLRRVAGGHPTLLLAGLLAADAAMTCGATYADELLAQFEDHPTGGVLRRIGVTGITLGVDGRLWNPAALGRASVPYDADTAAVGKRLNKQALQKRLVLREDDALPLVGICSRLVHEKGTDLLLAALDPPVRAGRLQLVLIGPATGELRDELHRLGGAAPGYLAHLPRFDQEMAWLTYAGADLTVMPSRVEPCGLNQLIAYRYGTLPVVTAVGGLRDTVVDLPGDPAHGSGFLIGEHTVAAVRATVLAAVDWLAGSPARLAEVRRRVMAQDWSWTRTAAGYADRYARLGPGP
jgi:starch synthase